MFYKALLKIVLLLSCFIILYLIQTSWDETNLFQIKQTSFPKIPKTNSFQIKQTSFSKLPETNSFQIKQTSFPKPPTPWINYNFSKIPKDIASVIDKYFNVWCIFTKVESKSSSRMFQFNTLITSILDHSSVQLSFHIITDRQSQYFAHTIFSNMRNSSSRYVDFAVHYYDVHIITSQLSELTKTMLPFFSARPGAYYSDALFFISLGLHKIAPETQSRAIMLDVDTKFMVDIARLFKEFNRFKWKAVVGIAPELTPVYQHILSTYRSNHRNSYLGSPVSLGGFPGVNSGVLLFYLERMRYSKEYNQLLNGSEVARLAKKYSFKGHLGDQDWYTLVGMDRPHLLYLLSCSWNRQLCDWWRDHGYRDTFDIFAQCNAPTRVYHGNCDSQIPQD